MRRWQKISLGVSSALLAVVGAAIGVLQVPGVQSRVLDAALHVAAQQTDTHIQLDGTHGFFPWTLRADKLLITRDDEKLVEAQGLVVSWSPLALVRKRIVIDEVTVETLSFWQPQADEKKAPEAFSVPDLSTLVKLRVTRLRVDHFSHYAPQAQKPLRFSVLGGFALMPEGQELRLDLRGLEIGTEHVQLLFDHNINADRLDLSADVELTDAGPFGSFLKSREVSGGRLKLAGSGPASNWRGNLSFVLDDQLTGALQLSCACNRDWALSLEGVLDGSALDRLNQAVGNTAPLGLAVRVMGQGLAPKLRLEDTRIVKGGLAARADAQVDFAPKTEAALTFTGTVSIDTLGRDDLEAYLPLRFFAEGALEQDGRLRAPQLRAETDFAKLTLTDFVRETTGAMRGAFQADVASASAPIGELQALELGRVLLSGALDLSHGQVITLRDGHIVSEGRALQAQISAAYDIPAQDLTAQSTTLFEKTVDLQGRVIDMQGPVVLAGRAEGLLGDGTAELTLQLPAFLLNGESVPPIGLTAHVEGFQSLKEAELALTSQGSTAWLSALEGTLQWQGGLEADCSGDLHLHLRGRDVSADVQGCLAADNPLAGGTAALEGQSLRWIDHTAGEIKANVAWAAHTSDRMVGSVTGTAKDLNLGGVLVPAASVNVDAARVGERLDARIEGFDISLREARYVLAAPIQATWQNRTLDVADFTLTTESDLFGEGALKISNLHVDDTISLAAEFDDVPLVALPAKANGRARLNLTPQSSGGTLSLTLSSRLEGVPPTEIFLSSDWSAGKLDGFADISFQADQADRMRFATWAVPLEVTRQGKVWAPRLGDGSAQFFYDGPIDPVVALLPIYAHQLTGHLALEGDLKMGARGPDWQGRADLTEASYAYARGGVALDHIAVRATASGRGMTLSGTFDVLQTPSSANGSEAGDQEPLLKGRGQFDFKSFEDWTSDIRLDLNNSPLLHHASYQGRASGTLALTASPRAADLKGHVSFDEINIQIPPPGPAEVIPLKIVPVDVQGEPIVVDETRNTTTWLPGLNLDVTLEADRQLYLTGRGINTEWQAKGVLKGPASAAAVSGSMQSLRGSIEFGGRLFDVERGSFKLTQGDVDGAQIDLQAKYGAPGGTLARILVGGTVGMPEISFTSTPPLPEEEIVALVLFGKPLAQLGPLEVLRTGTAVAQISGRTGGYDGGLLTRMRQSLGIDYLSIDPTGGGDETPVVTAGKYIGKGVFLKVIQGLGELTGALSVEYAVTDEITLSTEVNEVFQSEAAVEWKRDY
ncbi:MAG: hypothetical protein EP347_10230 [Alphaproteobacteria bacterium]|nr:MAG: hypothetical protein EP347_10230 [Alphaproteobacteria bacterium]